MTNKTDGWTGRPGHGKNVDTRNVVSGTETDFLRLIKSPIGKKLD